MTIKEEVKNLLAAFSSKDAIVSEGASKEEVDELSEYFVNVPKELEEWLILSNAPLIGNGGIFLGVKPAPDFRLIESVFDMNPDWEDFEWIPIANDGCGNYYVLDTSENDSDMHPIYFIDHEVSYNQPCYVVASGLWEFVRFVLVREKTKDRRFPFDKNYVLEKDPNLTKYTGDVPLAWQT